ncbi:MAG TPA: serine hydrolase domain-containing protein, partial [Acidimicrobiales bacterium]|nr:serine hydrolase domain-containing protein [Acidimicrobiales bacterium]
MATDRGSLDRAADYLRSWLAYRYPYSNLTGYTVAISWRGEVVLNEAYGEADVGEGTALTPGHVFRVASHSKTFTATALMQLAEKERLRLDDRVVSFLPWLSAHSDRRFRQVSLHQLLSHGGGVIRDGRDCDFWQLERPFPDAGQLREEVLGSHLVTEPNVALKYSNIGYSLLGMVVEEASGQTYSDYVIDHIVKPLGLTSTGPEWQGRRSEAVTGHTRRDAKGERRAVPQLSTRAMAAATGFYSTAEELCRYFTAHMCGSRQLLSDASKREMQRVQWHVHKPGSDLHEDYGLGLHLEEVGGRATFGHGGGFPGQITRSMAEAASGLAVVVLTNCADGPASEMARGIFGVLDFFERHREPARARWKGLEGRYANLWAVRDLVGAGLGLVATSPDTWQPFKECDKIE